GNSEVILESLTELKVVKTFTYEDMKAQVEKFSEKSADAIFHVAAVSDYLPKTRSKEKISSQNAKMSVELVQAPKLLEQKAVTRIRFKVACKLTTGDEKAG